MRFVLDAIRRRDFDVLVPLLDSYAKAHLLRRELARHGFDGGEKKLFLLQGKRISKKLFSRLKAIDLLYHRIDRRTGLYHRFMRTEEVSGLTRRAQKVLPGAGPVFLSDDEIDRAKSEPPPGRARWRQAMIKAAEAHHQKDPSLESVKLDWDIVNLQIKRPPTGNRPEGDTRDLRCANKDPYSEESHHLSSLPEFIRTNIL